MIEFNELEIIEIYEQYDRPILYTARDVLEHLYLIILSHVGEFDDTWLSVPLSRNRLDSIRSGGIDLRSAFLSPETARLFRTKVSHDGQILTNEITLSQDINTSILPLEGVGLELQTPLPRVSPKIRTLQTHREIINLKLEFQGLSRNEAPAEKLGHILSNFQDALNQIGIALYARTADLLVTTFSPGSFEIELASEDFADMFGYTKSGEIVHEFFSILDISDDPDRLKDELKEIAPKATLGMLSFFKAISGDVKTTSIDWSSPSPDKGGTAEYSQSDASRVVSYLEKTEIKSETQETYDGVFRGINLDTRHFSFFTPTNQAKISGKIAQEIIDSEVIKNIRLNKFYSATIKLTQSINTVSGEEKTTSLMINLEEKPGFEIQQEE